MQFINASSPISITLLGIVTFVKLSHPKKAASVMHITLFGIVKEVSAFPAGYIINSVLFLLYNTPPAEA